LATEDTEVTEKTEGRKGRREEVPIPSDLPTFFPSYLLLSVFLCDLCGFLS
jgi:hypothetical protein